ncbi:cell wall-binding repeat-containing protein [Kineococcus esterisolvens]|uniref:cell wall-binding repeat-containing protein n=1 Tax=unclassified Kineococcus TaxID=2621656 RepID=UPI003D7E8F46
MTAATSRLRRRGIGAGVAALVGLTGVGLTAAPAFAAPSFEITRPAQTGDRFETAASVALAAFPNGAENVIIANGDNAVDALAASVLAGTDIPILYVTTNEIPAATQAALTQLDPSASWIVGGTAAVSATVEGDLPGAIERLDGATRYATAANIAQAVVDNATQAPTTAFLARGDDFADALAIAPAAAKSGTPVLLTETGSLNPAAADFLADNGITNVTVLGGTAAVSEAVVDQLEAAGVTVERIRGANRQATAVAVAQDPDFAFSNTGVALVNGWRPVDALPASVWAAQQNFPIILTAGAELGTEAEDYLTANEATLVTGLAVGGTGVIPNTVVQAAEQAGGKVEAPATNQTLVVTPNDAVTLTAVSESGSTPTADDRQYTVTGLTADTAYVVKLVPTENVTDTSGQISFADDDENGVADSDAVTSTISVLNGAATTNTASQYRTVPVNGSITFTVDAGNDFENLTPVVYVAQSASTNFNLPLDANDAPTVPFGIGGGIQVLPIAGTNGAPATGEVLGADKGADWIATDAGTYRYDSNDRFYVVDAGGTDAAATDEVSLTDFENVLTATGGDSLIAGSTETSIYLTNTALQSRFILVNDAPVAPALTDPADATASVDASNTSAVVSVDEDSVIDGATVNVYVAAAGAGFEDAELAASSTTDADADAVDFQLNVSGLTAETTYEVYLTQTVGSEESSPNQTTAGLGTSFVTTEAPDTALTATSASITGDVNNGVGTSTTFAVTFSKALVTPTGADASGITVTPAGQSDYVIAVDALVVSASSDNRTVTFTLADALQDAPTDVTYTVRIPAGTFSTADGPNASLTATFQY